MKFCPMPPNICLTSTIAMTEPMAAIHQGALAGKVEGQQEARNNGAQIVDGRLLVSDFFIHQFGKNCKDDRYKHQCQRGRAKEPDGRQRG